MTLEEDEGTGEWFLVTDVENKQGNYNWTSTTQFPKMPPRMRSQSTPGRSLFAGNKRYNLGKPIEEDGGRVLRGERDLSLEAGGVIPFVRNYIRWEIWLDPPEI